MQLQRHGNSVDRRIGGSSAYHGTPGFCGVSRRGPLGHGSVTAKGYSDADQEANSQPINELTRQLTGQEEKT